MRLSSISLFLGAAALAVAQEDYDEEEVRENTYFNGEKCPPIPYLTPTNWDEYMNASKYLMVKHYRSVLLRLDRSRDKVPLC